MKLYTYPKSTTSYRVRAALNLKGVAYDSIHVDLLSGAQRGADYATLNPGTGVPTLVLDDGTVLTQSLAIIDYLDAAFPRHPLLSADAVIRAKMNAIAQSVACDIHPVNNLRVIAQLRTQFGADDGQAKAWMQHWMIQGFTASEAMVPQNSDFVYSNTPGLADLCITAQLYNAHRWGVDLTPFPKLARIERACLAIPAISAAHPDMQTPERDTI